MPASVSTHNSRARKRGVEATLTNQQWKEVLRQSDGICHYCKENIGMDLLGIDHLLPLSKGGGNSVNNVIPACAPCNTQRQTLPAPKLKKMPCQFCSMKKGHTRIHLYGKYINKSLWLCVECWKILARLSGLQQWSFKIIATYYIGKSLQEVLNVDNRAGFFRIWNSATDTSVPREERDYRIPENRARLGDRIKRIAEIYEREA